MSQQSAVGALPCPFLVVKCEEPEGNNLQKRSGVRGAGPQSCHDALVLRTPPGTSPRRVCSCHRAALREAGPWEGAEAWARVAGGGPARCSLLRSACWVGTWIEKCTSESISGF